MITHLQIKTPGKNLPELLQTLKSLPMVAAIKSTGDNPVLITGKGQKPLRTSKEIVIFDPRRTALAVRTSPRDQSREIVITGQIANKQNQAGIFFQHQFSPDYGINTVFPSGLGSADRRSFM